jgi:hypothetical protein
MFLTGFKIQLWSLQTSLTELQFYCLQASYLRNTKVSIFFFVTPCRFVGVSNDREEFISSICCLGDVSSTFLWNIRSNMPDFTVSQPRSSRYISLWKVSYLILKDVVRHLSIYFFTLLAIFRGFSAPKVMHNI